MRLKRVGDGLRATARDGPADGVRGSAENDGESSREGLVETEEGVRGETGEKSFCARAAEEMHQRFCGGKPQQTKTREQKRVRGEYADGAEDFGGERRPMLGERLDKAAPAVSVRSESGFGSAEIAFENYGGAVIEGMSKRSGRVNPVEAISVKRKGRKKWRARGERMDSGTEIVEEAREGEFESAYGAAGLWLGLEDVNVRAGLCEGDGGGEAVGPGADYSSFGMF